MKYNWNWNVLLQEPFFSDLISGLQLTVVLALLIWILAFTLGSLVGVAATLPLRPARLAAKAHVEIFRNIPPIVQLFIWFFVVPEVLPAEWGHFVKRDLPYPEFWTAVVALGLFLSARLAEQVRAGIEAIPRTLIQAALATGLSPLHTYLSIRLPIAYRTIVPTLTSEFLIGFKMTAVAMTIGVMEMTARSHQVESTTFQGIEVFTVATVFYVVAAAVVVLVSSFGERALRTS